MKLMRDIDFVKDVTIALSKEKNDQKQKKL